MERFEGRLDPSVLNIAHAKILSSTATGFDDDGTVSLFFRVASGLYEEAKDWLKANSLVYTDIKADFKELEGSWRTTTLEADTKNGGVIQRIEKGYYTEADWDYARLISDQRRPGGTSTDPDAVSGSQEERYLTYEFRYIAGTAVNDAVAAIETTKTDIPVVDGTWYLIDATASKADDGTHTIRALYANTSMFSLIGRDSYLLPGATKSYHYYGIPKQLAHSICALYEDEGDFIRPTYTGDGLVNITVSKREINSVQIEESITEKTCKFTDSTAYFYGVEKEDGTPTPLSPWYMPDNSEGITYSRRIRRNSDGTYDIELYKRERIAHSILGDVVQVSDESTTTRNQKIGIKSTDLSDITSTDGHIKRKEVRLNDDCTYDETIDDTEIKNQSSTSGTFQKLYTIKTDLETSRTKKAVPTSTSVGVRKTVRNTPTPEGKFRVESETVTAKEGKSISGIVYATKGRSKTTEKKRNSKSETTAITASVGKIKERDSRINDDGTFETEVSETTINNLKAERSGSNSALKTVSRKIYTSETEEQAPAARVQGEVTRSSNRPTEYGTFEVETEKATSIETVVLSGSTEQRADQSDVLIRVENQRILPELPATHVPGTISTRDVRINEDGTYNTDKRTITFKNQVTTGSNISLLLNEATVVNSSSPLALVVPDPVVGVVVDQVSEPTPQATFKTTQVTRTSTEHTVVPSGTVVAKSKFETNSEEVIVNKRDLGGGIVDEAQDGITQSMTVQSNIDGTVNIVKRTGTVSRIDSTVNEAVRRSAARDVHQTKSSNVRTADGLDQFDLPEPSAGTVTQLQKTRRADGTYDLTVETETERDMTATTGDAKDRYVISAEQTITEEQHTGASAPLSATVSAVEGQVIEIQNTPKENGLFATLRRVVASSLSTVSRYVSTASAAITGYRQYARGVKESQLASYDISSVSAGTTKIMRVNKSADGTYEVDIQEETETSLSGEVRERSKLRTVVTNINTAVADKAVEPASEDGVITRVESRPKANGLFETVETTTTAIKNVDGEEHLVSEDFFTKTNLTKRLNKENRTELVPVENKAKSLVSNINEFGCYDETEVTVEPKTIDPVSIVVRNIGPVKYTHEIFVNTSSVPDAASGVEYTGISRNEFGRWSYTKVTKEIRIGSGYTYDYYGPTITDDRSTYSYLRKSGETLNAFGVVGTEYYYIGVLTNVNKVPGRWKYTVAVSYHLTAAEAKNQLTDAYEGSGISGGMDGVFVATKITRVFEVA